MTEDVKANASVDTGSAGSNGSGSDFGQTSSEETVPKSQYDELFAKMGEMGEEVGVYRKFYQDVEPLIDMLEENPEIEQALMSGKFDVEMARAVLEGRVTQEEATTVADAHQQVKDNMGKEEYDKATPEELNAKVEQLVQAKLDAALKPVIEKNEKEIQEISSKMVAQKEIAENERKIRDFIANTPDFGEFSMKIQEKMEERPGLSVMESYELVKARHLVEKAGEAQNSYNSQSSKEIAANAGGGRGSIAGSGVVSGDKRNDFIQMHGSSGLGIG